jgi:hypothetical protein
VKSRRVRAVNPLIEIANDKISIITACRLVGMDIGEEIGVRGRKVHCPFGPIYHIDQGVDPAMRIYPATNHAYCFACTTSFTPVWLVAQAWGLSPAAAAANLLDRVGYRGASLSETFASARAWVPRPEPTLLCEALKTFCCRIHPGWEEAQFSPEVAATLSRCLALVDLVSTGPEAEQWLATCKLIMAATLQTHDRLYATSDPS